MSIRFVGYPLPHYDMSVTLMFIDFNGAIIKTYTNDKIQGLTSLPPVPDHSSDDIPLTSQGWNWTLSEIKSYNLLYPNTPITVGPLYCPTDEKTHIISETDSGTASVRIDGTAEVDWLDGTTETVTNSTVSHTISGDRCHYTIRAISWASSRYGITVEPKSFTTHIRCGKNLSVLNSQGNILSPLEDISCSSDITSVIITSSSTQNERLRALVLPKHSSTLDTAISLGGFNNLRFVASSYAKSTSTSSLNQFISGCPNICRFTVPDNVNSINRLDMTESLIINNVVIAGAIKTIDALYVRGNLIIESNVTTIGYMGLSPSNTYSLTFKGTTPPTCTSSSPLGGNLPNVIYVPYSSNHSVLNAYKSASGWSRYASIMQELP